MYITIMTKIWSKDLYYYIDGQNIDINALIKVVLNYD